MASVLRPGGVLAVAELSAARLDGEVFCVDEAFAPVDEVDCGGLRALAMLELTGTRMIAELDSALWINGIHPAPPSVHRVCVARTDRMKFAPSPRFVVREVTLRPGDVESISGMRVTVPARILFDLAVLGGSDSSSDAAALLERWPTCLHACVSRVEKTRNLPGKNAALARLREWTAQPALTRYTS
jgi:hypothetical protein